jgi:hypothetical protein
MIESKYIIIYSLDIFNSLILKLLCILRLIFYSILLDKLSTNFTKKESKSSKNNQRRPRDALVAYGAKSTQVARNIVNDIPAVTSSSAAKRGPGRPPASSRNVKAYHVDKDTNGNYVLPVEVGLHTILSLGTVVYDRSAYHNDRYIYPVGYSTQR